ncbi:hypothetical protein B0H19DRAFT_1079403 [Mycena capillaripes]|nr:hypothetical protein B0H19DRAFT_1079403 [Mycena capillaripes]
MSRTLENVVLHYARMSSDTIPPGDPAISETHCTHSNPLAGLWPSSIRHLSVNQHSSTAFSNCQRIQICGDMTCLLYMVRLCPSFIVSYTDNLLSPGSIHYLNDLVITMSLVLLHVCLLFYRLKPPSLPEAAYIGNAGRNWNCGPMSLCLGGGVSLDDLLH